MRRRVLAALLAGLAVLTGVPLAAGAFADATELRVVTVGPAAADGAVGVVVEVRPTPTGALPADAASTTVDGSAVPATTAALLDPKGRTALVVDASADGRAALPQALSAAVGYLFRLPPQATVTVTEDATPPRAGTAGPVRPADALPALNGVRAGGARSTTAALELALRGLPGRGAGRSLVLLQTTGAAPQDAAAAGRLVERLRSAGVVLAVVTTPGLAAGWRTLAEPTGGLAVGAAPDDAVDAFDEVAQTLQARSVVTFTPPAGATSAALRLRSGGDVVSADVPLTAAPAAPEASASAGAPPAGSPDQASQPASAAGRGSSAVPFVVAAFALEIAAVVALVLVRRRRRARTPAPAAAQEAAAAQNGRPDVEPAPAVAARVDERPSVSVRKKDERAAVAARVDERPSVNVRKKDERAAVAARGAAAVAVGEGDQASAVAARADERPSASARGKDQPAVPDAAPAAPAEDHGQVPPGVRVFDVSDPATVVEIEPAGSKASDLDVGDAQASKYVGRHRSGRHRPRPGPDLHDRSA